MTKTMTVSVTAFVLALAGCGGSGDSDSASPSHTTTAASQTKTTAACEKVALGTKDGQKLYASVGSPANVSCAQAQKIVRAWGRQQVGLGVARLPHGWTCDSSSVCRSGAARVGMTLIYG